MATCRQQSAPPSGQVVSSGQAKDADVTDRHRASGGKRERLRSESPAACWHGRRAAGLSGFSKRPRRVKHPPLAGQRRTGCLPCVPVDIAVAGLGPMSVQLKIRGGPTDREQRRLNSRWDCPIRTNDGGPWSPDHPVDPVRAGDLEIVAKEKKNRPIPWATQNVVLVSRGCSTALHRSPRRELCLTWRVRPFAAIPGQHRRLEWCQLNGCS